MLYNMCRRFFLYNLVCSVWLQEDFLSQCSHMKVHEIIRNLMKAYQITWHSVKHMQAHEITRNNMKWHVIWNNIIYRIKSHEIMKSHECIWNDIKSHEAYRWNTWNHTKLHRALSKHQLTSAVNGGQNSILDWVYRLNLSPNEKKSYSHALVFGTPRNRLIWAGVFFQIKRIYVYVIKLPLYIVYFVSYAHDA
jgi:hypothetical protein